KEKRKRTAFHFAAEKSDNSNLKWLVKELGSDCLTVPDKYGNMAVHLAAQHQPVDSLQFIFDQIAAEMFSLKNNRGETPTDVVESNRCRTDQSAKRAWISSTQPQLEASRPPAGSSAPTAASAGPEGPPLLERWDAVRLIGRGAFGEVHEVRTDTGVTCAAKTLRLPVQLGDELPSVSTEIHRAIESERNLCRLRHPNVVRFLHIAQPEPATVVVFMELLDGRSLERFIDNKPLDELTIRDFSEQICRALLYLHSRQPPVIHRDINCSNIIVCADNTRIKLIDFGLSIKLEQSVSHMSASTQAPKGTLNFMAPELLGAGESDSVQYSRESDIWAFGCSVFQMASGARPFANAKSMLGMAKLIDRKGAPALPDGRSAELQDFYSRCTAMDRRRRKAAQELLEQEFLRKNL
uniref:Protein kinase domain-containing protein n=1 Tax=Macrostomum lignano TaxID=282301 RepID=A0A1I8I663_9PLAT